MNNDCFTLTCIKKYMNKHAMRKITDLVDWQHYIVQLALPYEEGHVDGGHFVYDWLCYILNIDIYIWFVKTSMF